MRIEVHFTTQLRQALGRSQQSVVLESGATVAQLMIRLGEQDPKAFETYVRNSSGDLLPNIIVCVNDKQITHSNSCELQDGDVVTILSAISGG